MESQGRSVFPRILAVLALFAVSSNASAAMITGLFNTGVDASGTVLANGTLSDPHYTLVQVPAGSTTTRIITSAGNFPIGPWLADNNLSRWIVPNNPVTALNPPGTDPGDVSPAGDYVFATTFTLTGDPLTASVAGRWSTDNAGFITINNINGSPVGPATSPTQYSSWASFVINSGFQAGVNTIYFHVNNLDDGAWPVGVRVEYVPLPAAAWLLLSGLAGFGVIARRRKPLAG